MSATVSAALPDSYWHDARRPLSSLCFVLPWLLVYECGLSFSGAGAEAARNGADAWLRHALAEWGCTASIALPLVVLTALLVWQISAHHPWRLQWDTLAGMLAESLLFAFVLILCGQSVEAAFRSSPSPIRIEAPLLATGWSLRLISFVGAGIYEEFLFRLCLIPALYTGLRVLLLSPRWSSIGAILGSSVLFALAHYLPPESTATGFALWWEALGLVGSNPAHWFSFAFRLAAGVFFAGLFYWRGFGIAVGCHAVYDLVVGIVLMSRL